MRRAEPREKSPACDDGLPTTEPERSSDGQQSTKHHVEETHISRESILRRLSSQQDLQNDTSKSAMSFSSNLQSYLTADPDIPIPSREDPTQVIVEEIVEEQILIKEEPYEESELYSIPHEYLDQSRADSELYSVPQEYLDQSRAESDAGDTESQYSQASSVMVPRLNHDDGEDTPRAQSPAREPEKKKLPEMDRMSLPLLADFGSGKGFDFGLESYMTPSPPTEIEARETPQAPHETEYLQVTARETAQALHRTECLQVTKRPTTPEEQLQPPQASYFGDETGTEPGTPDSVIRHPVAQSPSPEVADPSATVKDAGSRLKTRPSITPADASTMAATRRQVSGQIAPPQAQDLATCLPGETKPDTTPEIASSQGPGKRISSLVPLDIPQDQSDESLGFGLEKEFDRVVAAQKVAFELSLSRLHHPFHGRFPSSEPVPHSNARHMKEALSPRPQGARALPGDQSAWGHHYPTDGSHFANRSPNRQRGYLMRQNTKVVVASNRAEEEAKPAKAAEAEAIGSTPRKISQQTWVTEPWNGKSRRRSIRTAGETNPRKKAVGGAVPPLPGHISAVQDGLGAVHEDEIVEDEPQDFDENAERGRLFVKVVGVKDLDLPISRGVCI